MGVNFYLRERIMVKKNHNLLPIVSLVFLSTVLISCARSVTGRPIDKDAVAKIAKGKTTKQDVLETFGKPSSFGVDSGIEMLDYRYTKYASKTNPLSFIPLVGVFFEGSGGKSSSQNLSLKSKDGIIYDYSYSESGEESSTEFLRQ